VRPTLEVNRTWSGYTDLDSKTIISATAHPKITCQLVAYQEPMKAIQSVQVAVHAAALPGALASLIALDAAEARVYGNPLLYDLEGGSIPIAYKFQSQLSKPVILLGSGLPEDNIHLGSSPASQQR
jgi:hypothetical protein